jgi:hypothetical protein
VGNGWPEDWPDPGRLRVHTRHGKPRYDARVSAATGKTVYIVELTETEEPMPDTNPLAGFTLNPPALIAKGVELVLAPVTKGETAEEQAADNALIEALSTWLWGRFSKFALAEAAAKYPQLAPVLASIVGAGAPLVPAK